jgi:hypothetical protein
MWAVKVDCALGINNFICIAHLEYNIFFILQFTIVNGPIQASKTQPLRNLQQYDGLHSAFGNWKSKKWRHFVNTIRKPF